VSVSSLEHAKKKLDLAAVDYGQAQRAQSTNSTSSSTYGSINTPVLNKFHASHQSQSNQGQVKNSFGITGTIDTPVLNEFYANHKATSPVSYLGDASQRLENGIDFNSFAPVTTYSARNYLGAQDTSATNSHSSTQLFNELNGVKPFASNAVLNPQHIINTSTPIFNPTLNIASKTETPATNADSTNSLSSDLNSGGVMDNLANTGTSSQNSFRGGHGNIVSTDTYRTPIDQSIINADTADLKSLKSTMTEAYSHYDTLRAGQSFAGAYGIHIAGQETQTNENIERAYQTYLAAEKAYNNAAQIHSDALMAKVINTDAATINQLESVKNNADFAQKSAQGKLENQKLFDNYSPSTGTLKRGQTVGAGTYSSIDYMTPNEQNVYAYMLSTDKAKAQQYKDALLRALNYRSMTDYQGMVKEQSDKNSLQGVMYNALGNTEKPFALVGTAAQTINNLASGKSEPLDRNSGYFIGSRTADTSEKALVDKAKTPFGKWVVKQGLGAMNAVPTILASVFSPAAGAAIIASESAGDAAYSVAGRGGTAAQATISGLVTGTVQYALAKMPLCNIRNIAESDSATTVKSLLSDYGKQYLSLSEMNVLSLYANNLTDSIVMGNKSAMNEYARQLKAQGMSEDEATKQAFMEYYVKQPLTSLRDTAFQAAVFAGSTQVFKGISNLNTIKAASPETSMSNTSKASPQLSEVDGSTNSSSTPIHDKTDEEYFLDYFKAKKVADLNKAYTHFQDTNPIDQNKTTSYNEGAKDTIVGSKYDKIRPTQNIVNPKKVEEYAKRLRAGEKIPPVQVIEVPGKGQYIINGHHRYVASLQTGIPVEIKVVQDQGPIGMPDWGGVQWKDYINEDQFWGD